MLARRCHICNELSKTHRILNQEVDVAAWHRVFYTLVPSDAWRPIPPKPIIPAQRVEKREPRYVTKLPRVMVSPEHNDPS